MDEVTSAQAATPHVHTLNNEILTVSELNRRARQCLERQFPLLWVSGEVSNLTRAASGHVYFSLKDDQAQVRCVMFRMRAQLVPWQLANGDHVEAQALVTLYETRGDFQLNIEALRRAGLGRLYERFLQLRDRLSAEGLFDATRKRPLPLYPRTIGLVTSPAAAALRDVVAALRRRAPHVALILYPTLVQGAEAPAALVAALEAAFRRQECDLLLVVRGGGSLEDLWAFNDERVVRTLARAPMPTISGVGHETDVTLVDFVCDRRAATPTAAAELASAGWWAAADQLAALARVLPQAAERFIAARAQTLDRLAWRLVHPAKRLAGQREHLATLHVRLSTAWQQRLAQAARRLAVLGARLRQARAQRLDQHARLARLRERLRAGGQACLATAARRLSRCQGALAALSPLATLERGYCLARTPAGALVRSAAQLEPGMTIHLQFAVGSAAARVIDGDLTSRPPHPPD